MSVKIIASLGVFLFCCCKTRQAVVIQEVTIDTQPKILFISYKFQRGELIFVNKIITKGKLKNKGLLPLDAKYGDLLLKQVDKHDKLLATEVIRNPRFRTIEYVDDEGFLQKKVVRVEEAEVNIRVMLEAETRKLIMEEHTEDQALLLNTIQIK